MSGDDKVCQNIISINKPGPQAVFPLERNRKDGFEYTHKKSSDILLPEILYPGGKEHPSNSVVGDIV